VPISSLDVVLDRGDSLTEQSILSLVRHIHIQDGRREGQWYDNPGVARIGIEDTDITFSPETTATHEGRSLSITAGVSVWDGYVSHFEFRPREQGDTVEITLVAYSVDELIARGLQNNDLSVITVQPILGASIALPVADYPSPSAIAVTDELIYVADSSQATLDAWRVSSQERSMSDDFALNIDGNEVAVGAAFDGGSTLWVADAQSGKVIPFDLSVAGTSQMHHLSVSLLIEAPTDLMSTSQAVSIPVGAVEVTATLANVERLVVSEVWLEGDQNDHWTGRVRVGQFQWQSFRSASAVEIEDGVLTVTWSNEDISGGPDYGYIRHGDGTTLDTITIATSPNAWAGDSPAAAKNLSAREWLYREVYALRATVDVSFTTMTQGSPVAIEGTFTATDSDHTALSGLGYSDGLLYACYSDSADIQAFSSEDGSRRASEDIYGGSAASGFIDVAIGPQYAYALSASNWIHVFNDGRYIGDIEYFRTAGLSLIGIRLAGERMFVLVGGDNKYVEVYGLQIQESAFAPRETSTDRVESLVFQLLGQSLSSGSGGVTLPARHWTGSVRDAIRRVVDSDRGRYVDGRLYPYGRARVNPSGNLSVTSDHLVKREQHRNIDSWRINVLQIRDYQQGETEVRNNVSIQAHGVKPRLVETDLERGMAIEVGESYLDNWGESVDVTSVELDALFEDDDTADRMLGSAPHTLVEFDGDTYVVLNREIRLVQKAGAVSTQVRLQLVDPSLWGIVPAVLMGEFLAEEDGDLMLLEDGSVIELEEAA